MEVIFTYQEAVVIKRIAILFSCLFILFNLSGAVMAADSPSEQEQPTTAGTQIPVGQIKQEVLPAEGRTGAEVFGKKGEFSIRFSSLRKDIRIIFTLRNRVRRMIL